MSTLELRGRYILLVFYRGNWCPLCTTQVQELAAAYRSLEARGVEVVCISPQPQSETRALAKRLDAPMRFCVDHDNRIAARLHLEHAQGIPLGVHKKFGTETVFPTVLLVDPRGTVIFADLTDNYRVRPEPQTFLHVLDAHEAGSSCPARS